MSAEEDRATFMRLMGLTAADVADPDSVPKHTSTCKDVPPGTPSSSAAAAMRSSAPPHKISSPAASSAAGLSHSTSLRGDSDLMLNTSTNVNTKASFNSIGGGGGGHSNLSSTSTVSTDRSAALLKASARSVSFDTPSTSPHPASASEALKEEGNRAFEAGRFVEAIQHYSAAIETLNQGGEISGGSSRAAKELLAALYSNRSAAYLQAARQWSSAEEAFGRALCDADRAVALRPSWFKGYTRQGDAYFKLRRYGTAAESYEMALQLDPKNTTLANALAETRQRAKQAAREELEMRRTMRAAGGSSHVSSTQSSVREFNSARYDEERSDAGTRGSACVPSTSPFNETKYTTNWTHRSSGQARQLWEDLKHEVEVSTQAPTGDAYRLQQLERFRKRGGAAAAEVRRSETNTPRYEEAQTTGTSEVRRAPGLAPQLHRSTPPSVTTSLLVEEEDQRVPMSASRVCDDCPSAMLPSSFTPSNTTMTKPTPTTTANAAVGPVPPPRRSTYDSPTAGGIPAAMANFSGPVTSVRDVPYEFSSAAASAYQQQLLEAFRKRKALRP